MDKNKPTLAIYGIQDRQEYEHPFYVHYHNLALMKNGKVISFLQQERVSRKKRDNALHNQRCAAALKNPETLNPEFFFKL